MKLESISLLTVCGLEELEGHRNGRVTHILSLLDPDRSDPDVFAAFPAHKRTVLRFHDIIDPMPGLVMPTERDVEAILAFGADLTASARDRHDGHLLVHCHYGISRSTAAMAMILAAALPDVDEADVLAHVASIRPQTWPNSVMIGYADRLLSRQGRFDHALRWLYGRQIEARPQRAINMRDIGRGREVDSALPPPKSLRPSSI